MKAFPFTVDEQSSTPLWLQLRERLMYLIETGYFQPGDQLPTVRGLASEIEINYNTVNKVYLSLVSDGYLESTRGRGVFVRKLDHDLSDAGQHRIRAVFDDCVSACSEMGMSLDDIAREFQSHIQQIKRTQKEDELNKSGQARIIRFSEATDRREVR